LSSAILYVAIVAIWAGVLIPRWLRRDSSASSGGSAAAEPALTEEPGPRPRPDAAAAVRSQERPGEPATGGAELPRGGWRDQEHKQVLAARRRLMGMLLVLVTGSGALAFTRLAAWWVVVPPVIMLLGYTTLLREAAKADAERRELARPRVVGAAPRPAAASPAAPPMSAGPAPTPEAQVIDISTSVTPEDEEPYDQYADAKLRAVGDLAHSLASWARSMRRFACRNRLVAGTMGA
jgi:hypothetical protein